MKMEFDTFVAHQCVDPGVYGTTEFQVTAQTDGKMIQIAVEAADGLQVSQGLGWMLMAAVTGIDHGDRDFSAATMGAPSQDGA